MWNLVEPSLAVAREEELVSKPSFFKPAIDRGARVVRHDGTMASAHAIIHGVIGHTPQPLRIQQELVDEQKRVYQTVAGEALLQELALLQQKHLREVQQLEVEIADALRQKDEEAQRELEEERRKVQLEAEKLEVEKRKLMDLKLAIAQREREQEQEQGQQQAQEQAQEQEGHQPTASDSTAAATEQAPVQDNDKTPQKDSWLMRFLRRKSRRVPKPKSGTKSRLFSRRNRAQSQ